MKLKQLFIFVAVFLIQGLSFAQQTPMFVTFVCTGNTGRSPMAEALAKDYISQHHLAIEVQSRGVNVDPKEIVPEEGTVTVLKERGMDISAHKAQQLTEKDVQASTYLLTMGNGHKEKILAQFPQAQGKVFTLAEFATGTHEELSDPYGKPLEAYKTVEGQLDKYLPLALDKIANVNKK